MRLIGSVALAGMLALTACEKPAEPVTEAAEAPAEAVVAEPVPKPVPTVTPTPETRIAAMQLSCGGESFRVAFEETRAVVIGADGSNTELTALEPQPDGAPGVKTYTDGKMTFTREGGQDTPTVIRYAFGRMAFSDCAIAQN